ncbi:hypothetical protein [Actinomycetospora straminea]|uniref:Signal transduction histidine kinase n=1 Tax=Actinomycetospora straminea TaxID=663607 RepID=A0ABP9EDF4_9PSEU|nr:hypothetical protein [Actinomycetospora straminea]MDD7935957.1 hypothetical protein [Actinomycetospora straminea]
MDGTAGTVGAAPGRAHLARPLITAGVVVLVLGAVVTASALLLPPGPATVWAPFLGAAVAVAVLRLGGPALERLAARLDPRPVSPYAALAAAGARSGEESLEAALAGLAQVLADGTRARRAAIWLAVDDGLAPVPGHGRADPVPDLAALLARPEVDHAVPVRTGDVLRAVLVLEKPGQAITPADRRLARDVAAGAGLLVRGAHLNARLAARVARADDLGRELTASRRRLTRARDAERRRLVTELAHLTTDRLEALRAALDEARVALDADDADTAGPALTRALEGLEDLIDRFRVVVRGVYPTVLTAQGPVGALEEMAADLPRATSIVGRLPERLAWEVESGLYYVAAAALAHLAERAGEGPVEAVLTHEDGRLAVLVGAVDDGGEEGVDELRAAVSEDADRLAALGGRLHVERDHGRLRLVASVPDALEPVIEPDVVGSRP